MSYCIRTKNVT